MLAGDGAAGWQRARGGDDHRVLARHELAPVLLVRLPRRRALRRTVAVGVLLRAVSAEVHQGDFPLEDRVHCVHKAVESKLT